MRLSSLRPVYNAAATIVAAVARPRALPLDHEIGLVNVPDHERY